MGLKISIPQHSPSSRSSRYAYSLKIQVWSSCCNTFLIWDDCVWLCFSTKGCVCDFGSSLVHKPVVQRLMVVKFGRVTSWERCWLLPTAVKDAPCCAVAMQLKNDALHTHACTIAQTSEQLERLILFLFFHISDSRYQAAFISIRLDTICDQLFRLVLSSLCLVLFLFCGSWKQRRRAHCGSSQSVTLPLNVRVPPLPPQRGSLSLMPLCCSTALVRGSLSRCNVVFYVVFCGGGDLFVWWRFSHPNSPDHSGGDTPPCLQTVCRLSLCKHMHVCRETKQKNKKSFCLTIHTRE